MTVDGGPSMVEVIEYTDPICSWAWGSEPKLRLLRWRHGHRCDWRVVMGGLVGDATRGRADWDPVLAAEPMSAYWKQTNGFTDQPYPMPMRRMVSSISISAAGSMTSRPKQSCVRIEMTGRRPVDQTLMSAVSAVNGRESAR